MTSQSQYRITASVAILFDYEFDGMFHDFSYFELPHYN